MDINDTSGVANAYIVNVAKQYQINSVPLGTADLVNTANYTRADEVQSDWLQPDSNAARYIRNKPTLATVATTGSAADLTKGVLPLTAIPQLPAPTISSGNFQIGSFAVDIIPTVDSQQSIGQPGASWNRVVTRNIAVNKSSTSVPLDVFGQGMITGSLLPQLSLVNPSGVADGTQPAKVTFDCTAQGSQQLASVGFAASRGLFVEVNGMDRLNVSVAGDTSISGSLTGVNTAAHRLGNLMISDFGQSTSTVKFAGIGNAVASNLSGGVLMMDDGSVRINAGGNASVLFQSRYTTNITIDPTGNIVPQYPNVQALGTGDPLDPSVGSAWGIVNTAKLNCTQQMHYQGKPIQPIATTGSASDLITGVAPLPRIPSLPADRITYGTYTVGSFATDVFPSIDKTYNLGSTTTRWKDLNVYSVDIKGYNGLGINCGGPIKVTTGFGITAHDETKGENAGNATIKADVFQSYYDTSGHTLGTAFTGCADNYANTVALWRHRLVASQATANAASDISTVYALKQTDVGVTTLNAPTSRSVNLAIANINQLVLTPGLLRPAVNSALDLGSSSFYYRNIYSTTGTFSGAVNANVVNLPGSSFQGYTSQLTNNSGWVASGSNISQFNNDRGYVTNGSTTIAGSSLSVNTGRAAGYTFECNGNAAIGSTLVCNGTVSINGTTSTFISAQRGSLTPTGVKVSNPNGPTTQPVGLFVSGSALVGGELSCTSDVRDKRDVVSRNPAADLATLLQIRPVTYKWIDEITQGRSTPSGVIAQELQEVVPDAVHQRTGFVPDIYCTAEVTARVAGQVCLALPPEKAAVAKAGDGLKLFVEDGTKMAEANVTGISSGSIWTDAGAIPDTDKRVFVWGRKVDDAQAVSYNQIFMLNVGATQALKQMVDEQKRTIDTLMERLAVVESRLSA